MFCLSAIYIFAFLINPSTSKSTIYSITMVITLYNLQLYQYLLSKSSRNLSKSFYQKRYEKYFWTIPFKITPQQKRFWPIPQLKKKTLSSVHHLLKNFQTIIDIKINHDYLRNCFEK